MVKFLKNILYFSLTGIIPMLILLISGYLFYDPFKVLRHYDDYSFYYITPNRDYISTEIFINNNKNYHYNSFVFGSSRTSAFKMAS